MRKGDRQYGTPFVQYKDTTANIEAMSGVEEGATAYSTDDNRLGSFNGTMWDWIDMAAAIHAADASAISDDDEMGFWENVSGLLKKITWANIKATLQTFFETIFPIMIINTEANILSITPSALQIAYGTDTQFFYVADGTDWRRASLKFYTDSANPDMGYLQNNSKDGYYSDSISDKAIANSRIVDNRNMSSIGDIRTYTDSEGVEKLQVYLNSTSEDVVTGFRFREDSDGNYEIEHKPVGYTYWYEILSGNSDQLGLDGKPIFQQYKTSMGCYQVDVQMNGGTF